jgi:hypothetical protein
MLATFMANFLQLFANGLSLLLNRILTAMLVASEWNSFVFGRRPLRVSHPRGLQRSSYFLSGPLRYGVPFTALKSLLQWMLSQSLFVVQSIQFSSPDFVRRPESDTGIVGYSALGEILTLVIAAVMIAVPLVLGARKMAAPVEKGGVSDGLGGESRVSDADG